jgi:glutamate carboxypeptidase
MMGKLAGVAKAGAVSVVGVALMCIGGGASAAEMDKALYARAEQAQPAALALLERLVNIDSGTFNGQGLDQVGAIAIEELRKLGAKVETSAAAPAQSRNIQATLTGKGKGRILLVAHMDTVFPDGAAAARPFRVQERRAYGPGIMDDKGGIVIALAALKMLRDSGFTAYGKITLLLNTNEETGSHGTRALMEKLAREHDVALNLEPGRAADGLVVQRKGSGEIELDVTGKAAHAGVAPDAGRNAAMEAAHQMLQLAKLGDSAKQTTVNFTVIKSGERSNVIPDRAEVQADVRVAVPEEFDRVEKDLARISAQHLIPDTTVTARLRRGFPPMPKSPVTDALAAKAQAVYAELGRKLTLESSGGAADSSLTFAAGVPSIDGLGIVGGGIHTPEEYAEVDSIAPRAYLLARLIMEYGQAPR